MQLVIAEKPSVARDLARVLGVRATGRNAIEGPGRVITWCIGHLVELEEPAAYDPRWKSWRMDTLPMIPSAFKLRAVSGTRDQLRVVRDLLRDRRFTEVVNGCDAGREGELIFRYVYELAGSRLPVRRLWISSLTDEAIRQGFASLRPGADYDGLGDAARCRSEADWLVGMNATRAVTIRFRATDDAPPVSAATPTPTGPPPGKAGKAGKVDKVGKVDRRGQPRSPRGGWRSSLPPIYSIGRVQTPTLGILVRREQTIRAFVPSDYWEIRATFTPEADGTQAFTALWTIRRDADKGAITRLGARALADAVVIRAGARASATDPGGPIVETLVQKRSREPPPLLFDLTSLQRTANRRYGLSASRTLEVAQALYERHKVLTYPRTDSRHLPQDLAATLPQLFRGLAKIPVYEPFAEPLVELAIGGDAVRGKSRRIFDASKVHDHHAIIPTGKVPGSGALDQHEQRIFDLVVRRFLGAFHPDAEFALTEAVIRVGDNGNLGAATGPAALRAALALPSSPSAPTTVQTDEILLTELPPPPDRFVARGRVRLVAGWQAVAGLDDRRGGTRPAGDAGGPDGDNSGAKDKDAEATLPPLSEGQRLAGRFETLARQTRPPPRHTEATLLGAMESAGREIEDEALRAAMKETGLGTPATRAATIETLVKRGFILREGKQVAPTPTGIALIERLPVPTLASPELTGAWEARLVRIARGQDTRAAFMTDIGRYVREVTDAVRRTGSPTRPPGGAHVPAPKPGGGAHIPAPKPGGAHVPAPKPGGARETVPRLIGALAPAPARSASGHARNTAVPTPASPPALLCPRCRQGSLIAGKRGWGCSHWRDGCPFVIWFEVAGKRITDSQLRDLVDKGKTRKGKWPQPGLAEAVGRLELDLTATQQQGAARFSRC